MMTASATMHTEYYTHIKSNGSNENCVKNVWIQKWQPHTYTHTHRACLNRSTIVDI